MNITTASKDDTFHLHREEEEDRRAILHYVETALEELEEAKGKLKSLRGRNAIQVATPSLQAAYEAMEEIEEGYL